MLSASRVSNHVTLERAYPIVTTIGWLNLKSRFEHQLSSQAILHPESTDSEQYFWM